MRITRLTGIRDSNSLNLACTVERMRCVVTSRSRISTNWNRNRAVIERCILLPISPGRIVCTIDVPRVITNQRLPSVLRGGYRNSFSRNTDTRHFARQFYLIVTNCHVSLKLVIQLVFRFLRVPIKARGFGGGALIVIRSETHRQRNSRNLHSAGGTTLSQISRRSAGRGSGSAAPAFLITSIVNNRP